MNYYLSVPLCMMIPSCHELPISVALCVVYAPPPPEKKGGWLKTFTLTSNKDKASLYCSCSHDYNSLYWHLCTDGSLASETGRLLLCPPSLEDGETLRSFNGTASGLPAGFFVGLNLDTSSPDTFRPPPAPIPFNVLFGRPQTPVDSLGTQGHKCDSAQQSIQSGHMTDTSGIDKRDISTACGHVAKSEGRTLADILLASPTKSDVEISRPCEFDELAAEEEDVCPICLEEYDVENPKMVTNCEHDFHLSCLLEWMERSDSCPVCDKEMIFDHPEEQL